MANVEKMEKIPDLETIRQAHERIKPYINRTPILTCSTINKMSGATIFFKCENFQKAGAFKIRGSGNVILSLDEKEVRNGVVTYSSGNHAQATSLAAGLRKIPAYIAMPSNSTKAKIAAVEGYGGKITFSDATNTSREETAAKLMAEKDAYFIHPIDNYRIIAGDGTIASEIYEDIAEIDYLLVPVSGGGLISGNALCTRYLSPRTKVIGCEPKNADDAYRSMQAGKIIPLEKSDTIADGLRATLSEKTFSIIRDYVEEIITITEKEIIHAMRTVWERMKIIIEPSSAIAVSPLLTGKLNASGKRVAVILTGGNVDLNNLPF